MKWIKASERLPDVKVYPENILFRFIESKKSVNIYSYWDDTRLEERNTDLLGKPVGTLIDKELIEWLDETKPPTPVSEQEIEFCNITIDELKEIATLCYGYKEWITSDIQVKYNPHIEEHYEDADEYFQMDFEGYFMGNTKARYKVQLRPSMNVVILYTYKDEVNKLLHVSNQKEIQKILSKYKAALNSK